MRVEKDQNSGRRCTKGGGLKAYNSSVSHNLSAQEFLQVFRRLPYLPGYQNMAGCAHHSCLQVPCTGHCSKRGGQEPGGEAGKKQKQEGFQERRQDGAKDVSCPRRFCFHVMLEVPCYHELLLSIPEDSWRCIPIDLNSI